MPHLKRATTDLTPKYTECVQVSINKDLVCAAYAEMMGDGGKGGRGVGRRCRDLSIT